MRIPLRESAGHVALVTQTLVRRVVRRLDLKAAIAMLVAISAGALRADVYSGSLTETWSGSQAIPDNNASGVAFPFTISTPVYAAVTNLTVDLQLSGGWNGDLYAYLSHSSGFSVLLNRVGRTAGNPLGFGDSGMNVEFSDSYATDIHNFSGTPVVGQFAPDARNTNPIFALDTDARSAFLISFTGLDVAGTWTLFIADLSPAAVSTVQGWTVKMGVTTIPEPGGAPLFLAAILVGFLWRGIDGAQRQWPRTQT